MRAPLALTLLLSLVSPAHAHFVVTPPGGADDRAATTADAAPKPPPRSSSLIARGFGRDIPLSFAVRQIVPPDTTVTYGQGVNPEQVTVTWHGGPPWLATLRAALVPLKLHVLDCDHRITITFLNLR